MRDVPFTGYTYVCTRIKELLISYSTSKVEEIRSQFTNAETLVSRYRKTIVRHITRKRFIRTSLVTLNATVLVIIVLFVLKSSPLLTTSSVNITNTAANNTATQLDPLDQLSSADIAVTVAQMTSLPETTAVINQADSVSTQLALPPSQDVVISKPQAVDTAIKTREDIENYVTQSGDTVSSLAAKFGVTSNSIMWSNNITGNTLVAGTSLLIPPVNGIVYTVKSGDTPATLAQKYTADANQITAFNDAEISGLTPGEQIVIPNGQQPAPVVVAPTYSFFSAIAVYGYNGYDFGFCTWYVANKRIQMGDPVPANLGDATTWDYRAAAEGLTVNRTPAVGAAVVTSHIGEGHVAFVEQVNSDGSVWVSEMNSYGQKSMTDTQGWGGYDTVDYKLLPAGAAETYDYIH